MLAATADAGTAAFLFTYRVSDTAKFDAAYRKHLEWHRSHQDHLSWYAWYVISGPRTGMFVDGTFGSDFAAFDGRPDPKGDAEDFLKGAALHSTASHHSAWMLWREASTDFSLEEHKPTALIDAITVLPRPGAVAEFEAIFAKPASSTNSIRWAWYRAAAGEQIPAYLVLMPRAHWAELDGRPRTLGGLIAASRELSPAAASKIDAMVEEAHVETWRYRADLSLFPND